MTFIEQDCTITHDGMKFESGGAVITDQFCRGYLDKDGVLTDWHGNQIGSYRIVSSWPIYSFITDRMNAVHAMVNGKLYKGRSAGVGMCFNGKLSK